MDDRWSLGAWKSSIIRETQYFSLTAIGNNHLLTWATRDRSVSHRNSLVWGSFADDTADPSLSLSGSVSPLCACSSRVSCPPVRTGDLGSDKEHLPSGNCQSSVGFFVSVSRNTSPPYLPLLLLLLLQVDCSQGQFQCEVLTKANVWGAIRRQRLLCGFTGIAAFEVKSSGFSFSWSKPTPHVHSSPSRLWLKYCWHEIKTVVFASGLNNLECSSPLNFYIDQLSDLCLLQLLWVDFALNL